MLASFHPACHSAWVEPHELVQLPAVAAAVGRVKGHATARTALWEVPEGRPPRLPQPLPVSVNTFYYSTEVRCVGKPGQREETALMRVLARAPISSRKCNFICILLPHGNRAEGIQYKHPHRGINKILHVCFCLKNKPLWYLLSLQWQEKNGGGWSISSCYIHTINSNMHIPS